MKNPLFDNAGPWSKIVFTIFIMAVSFLIFFLIGHLISGLIYGFTKDVFSGDFLTQAENIGRLRILQAFQSIGLFVVPAWLAAELFAVSPSKYLLLRKQPAALQLILIFILIISIQPSINFLAELNHGINLPESLQSIEKWMQTAESQAEKLTHLILLTDRTIFTLLINLVIVAVIPAVGEELLFRGVLQKVIHRHSGNYHLAIWLAAFLFSAIHFQFYGFLPRLFLGAMFGYLLVFGKNMWLPVAAHFFNNAAGVFFYHFFYKEETAAVMETVGTEQGNLLWLIPSILISAGLYYLIVNNQSNNTQSDLQ